MDVDVAGVRGSCVGADAGAEDPAPAVGRRLSPRTSWVAFSARAKSSSGVGDVVADDLVVGAAERLDQQPLRGQGRGAGAGQPVRAGHVHGEQVAAGGAGGDPGRPPDQGLALGAAGEGDDDALAGLPGAGDVVRRRGTAAAPRRPGRPATAGPARAAR